MIHDKLVHYFQMRPDRLNHMQWIHNVKFKFKATKN